MIKGELRAPSGHNIKEQAGKMHEEGTNLFIYHLPQEFKGIIPVSVV